MNTPVDGNALANRLQNYADYDGAPAGYVNDMYAAAAIVRGSKREPCECDWEHGFVCGDCAARKALRSRSQVAVIRNVYKPHPMMIDSGTFWRCDHGSTGYEGDMKFVGCPECKAALGTPTPIDVVYALTMRSGVSSFNDTFIGWFDSRSTAQSVGELWLEADAKHAPEYREFAIEPVTMTPKSVTLNSDMVNRALNSQPFTKQNSSTRTWQLFPNADTAPDAMRIVLEEALKAAPCDCIAANVLHEKTCASLQKPAS